MKIDVILGLQWGDEGKGKIVDVLTPKYNTVARFQGGPNAGHTLLFQGKKHVLHTIPSGIFHPNIINIVGSGMVIDPVVFITELDKLAQSGFKLNPANLQLSKKAHIILPTHKLLDAAQERAKGERKIGSTLKGIGPTYTDKINRSGLRIGDIAEPNFKNRYEILKTLHLQQLEFLAHEYELAGIEEEWFTAIEKLRKFALIDSEYDINRQLKEGKKILAEGAQGSLLDIDFGSYPFVTSSNTVCAGTCIGLGVPPSAIGEVMGIMKAYCTRVGSGPFPSELKENIGENLRQKGGEFGSTTGRARRTGWLDLVALKYAIMVNGVTQLMMMKADVLDEFSTIKVAVKYKIDGKETDQIPYGIDVDIEPVYKEFKGWKQNISNCRKMEELPQELLDYIRFIENETGVKMTIVSVGPDREQTIMCNPS